MEDLFDVQAKHMGTLLEGPAPIQEEDLVTRAIFEISTTAGQIMSAFHAQRFLETPVDPKKLKKLVFSTMEWVTTLFYCLNMEPPEIEDVTAFANTFESEIASDTILSSLHIQKSIADFALCYFCDNENMNLDEVDGDLAEVLACLELISRRLETTLPELIMNI